MKENTKNPYISSFISLALICSFVICFIFGYININNSQKSQRDLYQRQVSMVAEDLETQLQTMRDVSLHISINTKYWPMSFDSRFYDTTVLKEFKQYGSFSAISDECFLHYKGETERLYLSTGYTSKWSVYLQDLPMEIVTKLETTETENALVTYVSEENIYCLFPLTFEHRKGVEAVLGFKVEKASLEKRVQLVTGRMPGSIAVYEAEKLLFANEEQPCVKTDRGVITTDLMDGSYHVCYMPAKDMLAENVLSVSLLIGGALCIISLAALALFLASEAYRPILNIAKKYNHGMEQFPSDDQKNALEQMDLIMDQLQQKSIMAAKTIYQNQEMLRRQFLSMLLNGTMMMDINNAMDKCGVLFPGPYYFAMTALFEKTDDAEFVDELIDDIENLSSDSTSCYVYTLYDAEKSRLSIVCSIHEENQETQFAGDICEIIKNCSYKASMGRGKVYDSLERVSASWLESNENGHQKSSGSPNRHEDAVSKGFISFERWDRFFGILSEGDEHEALAEFEQQIDSIMRLPDSVLLQRYVIAAFLNKYMDVATRKGVKLSSQETALLASSRDVSSLVEVAPQLVRSFCQKIGRKKEIEQQDMRARIVEYIETHFTEYDISIEKVSRIFQISTAEVRQTILQYTGLMYKDYLIQLRIEYAKTLLLDEHSTVQQICRKVGYESLSYFVKLFKKMTGMSPSQFRGTKSTFVSECEK